MTLAECEDCGWRGPRDELSREFDRKEPLIVDGFTVLEDTYNKVCPKCHSRNLVDRGKTKEKSISKPLADHPAPH